MSLEDIKCQIAEMTRAQQDQLAAYLVHLRHEHDSKIRSDITAKIDDRNPSNWITLEELRESWKD